MKLFEKCISSKTVYEGIIVNVRRDIAELENGKEVKREVVEHPGGVAVIPIDENNMVYCVRQFRYPMSEITLEIPAGKLDANELPFDCAVRELSEETGLTAGKMINLGACYTSPGYSTEVLHIFLALELKKGESHPDEDEFLSVEKQQLGNLVDDIMCGKISDAKTVIAVLKANEYLTER